MKIRAHHLLCIPRFKGGGYNNKFSKNLKRICFDIRKNPNLKIKVLKDCDDICEKCLHKKENICKKTQGLNYWILRQDNKVLKKLKIKENSIHTAWGIFNLSINNITNQELKEICYGCEFLKYCLKRSFNKSFIKNLK